MMRPVVFISFPSAVGGKEALHLDLTRIESVSPVMHEPGQARIVMASGEWHDVAEKPSRVMRVITQCWKAVNRLEAGGKLPPGLEPEGEAKEN
jgi:hypothetical protein